MKKRFVTTMFISAAVLAAAPSVAAAKGGNSDAAKKCQKNGWKEWVRSDRTPFKNQGECVSYAAKGGTLTPKASPAELTCTEAGGGFAVAPDADVIWSCTVPADGGVLYFPLIAHCDLEPGSDGLGITFVGVDDWRYECRAALPST